MASTVRVKGKCDPQFLGVREAFADNFDKRGEVGAGVCVYVAGKLVVNLWGGYADAARTRPWEQRTMVNMASTTKGITAICAHKLVDRGCLDLDAPVARYWPEFAQADKGKIPVRWLLSHQAGLPAVKHDLPSEIIFDWPAFIKALEKTAPWWEPGTQHGYHALTYGYLVGEVVRRISDQSVGQFLSTEISGPLKADCFIGVPESEDYRVAEILPEPMPDDPELLDKFKLDPKSMAGLAFLNPPREPGISNTRAWRAAEIPAINGHTTAKGLARIYGALAHGGTLDGIRLVNRATIEAAILEQACGPDAILSMPTRFGLGFMLTQSGSSGEVGTVFQQYGPNPRTFGHPGRGGSIGFADPDAEIGFGYVMNQYMMSIPENPDLRWPSLVNAVYASLGSTVRCH